MWNYIIWSIEVVTNYPLMFFGALTLYQCYFRKRDLGLHLYIEHRYILVLAWIFFVLPNIRHIRQLIEGPLQAYSWRDVYGAFWFFIFVLLFIFILFRISWGYKISGKNG